VSEKLPQPRADLGGFQPYRTQQMNAEVRLQANEWAEPNRAGAWLTPQELDAVLLNRYPGAALELREALAERYHVGPEQLIIGNGSNEVLLNTFLVFGGHGRRTLLYQPTYSMHGRLSVIAGGTVVDELVGLPSELSRERALAAAARADAHVICFTTPNNPTGNEIGFEVILAVAEAHPETLILVDEAYSDFSEKTILPELATQPNLVISKTFSKVRAAAGLRLGILITHPKVADLFRAVQLPYNVSSLTHAVAAKIARDDASVKRRIEQCRTERVRVYAALREVDAIEVYPSVTNFILFRVKDGDTAGTHRRFLDQSILIRDISSWPGCERCLRVSIGTPEENGRFIAALAHAFPIAARA
jgi:histidinol-phosphate aminotransferase